MNINEYLEDLKSIYINVMKFIDMEDNVEENYQNVISIFENHQILGNRNKTKLILNLISSIADNHHRGLNFIDKIEKILLYFRSEFTKVYKNDEIYYLFFNNIRILLFLIKEKILIIDSEINNKIERTVFNEYFYPEIKEYQDKQANQEKNDDDNQDKSNKDDYSIFNGTDSSDDFNSQEESLTHFDYEETNKINHSNVKDVKSNINFNVLDFLNSKQEGKKDDKIPPQIDEDKRLIGENDKELYEIIRKDLIEEFIIYVNKNEYPLKSEIKKSIYETNVFLISNYNYPTLIEYAAFFGSIQIFKYLYKNGVELTSSLWLYSIHGDNEEMIHILEENNIKPNDKTYAYCYIESIKCHHNDIAKYIESNYLSEETKGKTEIKFSWYYYYNFELLPKVFDNELLFMSIIYDYYTLTKLLMNDRNIDINRTKEIKNSNNSYSKKHNAYITSNFIVTPLIATVDCCKVDVLQLLLSNPNVDLNIKQIEKKYCYNFNDYKINFDYIKEKSLLQIAIQNQNIEILKILLSRSEIDVNDKYIKKKITGNVVNNIIDLDDPNTKTQTVTNISLLSIAISKNFVDAVQLLLSNPKINVNSEEILYLTDNCWLKYSPLINAIRMQNLNAVRLLLSNNDIDVNCKLIETVKDEVKNEKTALYEAVETANIDIVQLLLSHEEIDINAIITVTSEKSKRTSKRTALYKAVKENKIDIVKLLLLNPNIDVNIKTIDTQNQRDLYIEKTALYVAVKNKNIEIIKHLLSNPKIDVNIESFKSINNGLYKIKRSVLYEAVEKNCVDIIQLLLSKPNLDVNARSLRIRKLKSVGVKKTEKTILYKAVEFQNLEVIQLLLSNQNVDVNAKSFGSLSIPSEIDGDYNKIKTLLHLAVLLENIQIIKLLISNESIDINAKDELQKTPIDIAKNDLIISLLNEH